MEWWLIPVIWWVGMLPASWLCGRAQGSQKVSGGKPFSDGLVIACTIGWPILAVFSPVLWFHYQGQRARKAKGNGKPE